MYKRSRIRQKRDLEDAVGGELSSIEETMNLEHAKSLGVDIKRFPVKNVKANTLTYYVSKYNEFRDTDVISIDAEDHELSVLQGIDFNNIKTKCFIIETHLGFENKELGYVHKDFEYIKSLLNKAGYVLVLRNAFNTVWIRSDIVDNNKINEITLKFKKFAKLDCL